MVDSKTHAAAILVRLVKPIIGRPDAVRDEDGDSERETYVRGPCAVSIRFR